MNGRTRLMGLVLVLALAACSSAGSTITPPGTSAGQDADRTPTPSTPGASMAVAVASPSPTMSAPTPSPSTPTTPKPTSTVEPTPRPSPTSTASTEPPVTFKPDDTAIVVADAVRAHNDHSVESMRFTPMLAKGTSMLVLEGPKHGSGYHWYRVALINATLTGVSGDGPDDIRGLSVWVPVASRDGDAWLRHGKARCPAKPTNVPELYSVPLGARVTCFDGIPITITAKIVASDASCDYDPGMSIRPRWFSGESVTLADGSRNLVLATPAGVAPDPPCPPFDTLLYVDPAGKHPDPLPLDRRVTVTGMFDHPAAARCRWKWGEDPWQATDACRSWFVATKIVR